MTGNSPLVLGQSECVGVRLGTSEYSLGYEALVRVSIVSLRVRIELGLGLHFSTSISTSTLASTLLLSLLIPAHHTSATLCGGGVVGCGQSVAAPTLGPHHGRKGLQPNSGTTV